MTTKKVDDTSSSERLERGRSAKLLAAGHTIDLVLEDHHQVPRAHPGEQVGTQKRILYAVDSANRTVWILGASPATPSTRSG